MHDPVLAPWHAFAALPRQGFAVRAWEVRGGLARKDVNAATVHPLVARCVLGTSPSSMAEVVDRYVALLAQLEQRGTDQAPRSPGGIAKGLPEPEWESLRQA